MRAGGPIGQRIRLAAHRARRIVAGKAQLPAGAVLHQEVLRDHVLGLHVGIVAGRALDAAVDQLHRARADRRSCRSMPVSTTRWTLSFMGSARLNGCEDCILSENTSTRVHRSDRRHLPVGHRVAHGHRAVMAAQAHVAAGSEHRLDPVFFIGVAGAGVYIVYGWVVSFWFQRPMFNPECGAWQ